MSTDVDSLDHHGRDQESFVLQQEEEEGQSSDVASRIAPSAEADSSVNAHEQNGPTGEQEAEDDSPARLKSLELQPGEGVYTWGQGGMGQLGHGDDVQQPLPRVVDAFFGKRVMQVACGNQHTAVLTADGVVYTFGRGNFGQLGLGTTMLTGSQLIPRPVVGIDRKCLFVACGWYHTAVVTDEGSVYTFGAGEYGRLGHGDEANHAQPTRVANIGNSKHLTLVACGAFHTLALSGDGVVYSWGGGYFGQLGHGDDRERRVPRMIKSLRNAPCTYIAAGTHHSAVVTEKGEVLTFGSGEYGKLGHGDDANRATPTTVDALRSKAVTRVSCGGFHTAAVTADGSVFTWGCGDKGQLGLGDRKDKWLPRPLLPLQNTVVRDVSCGTHHTLLLTDSGHLFSCGNGEFGRLGLGDSDRGFRTPQLVHMFTATRVLCISAGSFHSAALTLGLVKASVAAGLARSRTLHRASSASSAAEDWDRYAPPEGSMRAGGPDGDMGYDDMSDQRGNMSSGPPPPDFSGSGPAAGYGPGPGGGAGAPLWDDRSGVSMSRAPPAPGPPDHVRSIYSLEDEVANLRRQLNRARTELGQRTEDCERLQMEISRLEGDDTAFLSLDGLDELERTYYDGLHRISSAKVRAMEQDTDAKLEDVAAEIERAHDQHSAFVARVGDETREIRSALVQLKQDQSRLRLSLLRRSTTQEQAIQQLENRMILLEQFCVHLRDFVKHEFASRWAQLLNSAGADAAKVLETFGVYNNSELGMRGEGWNVNMPRAGASGAASGLRYLDTYQTTAAYDPDALAHMQPDIEGDPRDNDQH